MTPLYSFAWKLIATTTQPGNFNISSQFFLIETMWNLQPHLAILPWSSRYRVFKRSTVPPDQTILGHRPLLPNEGEPHLRGGTGFILDIPVLFVASPFYQAFTCSRIDRYCCQLRSGPRIFCGREKLPRSSLYSGGFASILSSPLCLTRLLVRLVGCRS